MKIRVIEDLLFIDKSEDFKPYILKAGIFEVDRLPSLWQYKTEYAEAADWICLKDKQVGLPFPMIEKAIQDKKIEILA